MKGIILAGGTGSRLFPLTKVISKQLLPIHDKPMIYYPLSVLMLAGIREILIITTPRDIESYRILLGDGSNFGINLFYEIQDKPEGLAQAFVIGENFIGNSNVALILGDNIFYGQGLTELLKAASKRTIGATIFGYRMKKPQEFGVIEYDKFFNVLSIEEKPKNPKSDLVSTGLYFYDNTVCNRAKEIKKSERGEYEITSLNNSYLNDDALFLEVFGRGFAWLDTGIPSSLLEASQFVETLERTQGLKIACLEEIALGKKWITPEQLLKNYHNKFTSSYEEYIRKLISEYKGK